jgi:hypothetical protein
MNAHEAVDWFGEMGAAMLADERIYAAPVFVRALEGLADAARIRASLDSSSLWAGLFDLRENLLGRTLEDLRALAA